MGCLWSWCCDKPTNDDDDDDGADSASTFDDSDDSDDDQQPLRESASDGIRQRGASKKVQSKNKGWESDDELQSVVVVDSFSAMDINR